MPLVRYEIRNEYSLAKPELYRSAGKDESDVLLEGVAMAGLVGILRQLGDLAQFAAEIFHSVHEEIMATAARSHGLTIRIQQLEAEVPSIEKALMDGTNQVRFAHSIGSDWRASIPNHQNHLTYSELPYFIRNAYEECRGPPRLFTLDKFDIAGTGACLKRYTDPSFFKTEWASSELRKAENAQRDRYTARLKKRMRRQRNSETTEVTVTSQQNSRAHFSVFDVADLRCAPGNQLCTANHILESKQRKQSPSAGILKDDQAKDDLVMGEVKGFQPVNISDKDTEERRRCGIMQMEEKFVFVNRERMIQAQDDLTSIKNVGGEPENFADAFTTMESEIEIDSECQIKQEVNSDIISEDKETGCLGYTKSHEQPVQCSVFLDMQSLHKAKSSGGGVDIRSSTPSEGSVEQYPSLASVHASPQSGEKGSTIDLDSDNEANAVANCVSSECSNIVWTTDVANEEPVHDHDNITLLAPAVEIMADITNNFGQKPDAVQNHSSSFAFSNTELTSSLGCVHVSTDSREKDPTAVLDSGKDCNLVHTTYTSTEMVLDDHFDKPVATTAGDVPLTSTSFFQKPEAALDRSSSFAFSNFESSNVSLNATPSACFDSGDALFRFVTPELSIMYSDAKFASSIIIEDLDDSQLSFISGSSDKIKPVSVSENSKYKCNQELENALIPSIPPNACENELESCSDLSELASHLHNLQDAHLYPDMEIDDTKSEIPRDSVSCDKTYSEHENISISLAGCISPQSEIEETCMEYQIGNSDGKHSTGLCAYSCSDPIESSMDVETVGDRVLDVSSSDDILKMKPVHMYGGSSDSSVVISTASNHRDIESHPELQSFQIPVNYACIPSLENKEFSCDLLGDEPICRSHNSKVVGTVLENNLISDVLTKDISVDMLQAELATVGHMNSASGLSPSNSDCHEISINEFKKDGTEVFVIEESPNVSCSTMSPASILHSRSLVESAITGSNNFYSTEIKTRLFSEVHTGRLHTVPSASSALNSLLDDHPHKESIIKHSSADLQSHDVDEQHWGNGTEGSISSLGKKNTQGHDISSSFQDQTDISFSQPTIRSPSHVFFAGSNYYPENLSPKRGLYNMKSNDLSPFCLLPESVIPLGKELEGKNNADCTNPSSNNLENSSQAIIVEMQSLKLSYTADGREGGHHRSHVINSSDSFSDHFVESTTESAVFPEMNMSANGKLGSSRILLTSSLTNSLSSHEPRSSILTNLDDDSVEYGDNSDTFRPSPRPWTSIGFPLPASQDNNTHDVVFDTSQIMNQYEAQETEDLVSSSLNTESNIPLETPPPPPLPPLNWWITRPKKVLLASFESAVPLAPPPPPSKLSRLALNSQSQKTSIERNDSLIDSIALHDKTRLKKVIQQTQSLKAKPLTEREKLLEQIRKRSFSLRPTVTKKLEIPRPEASINVTAILKKASAIRKAVGSEDEDDDWSDA